MLRTETNAHVMGHRLALLQKEGVNFAMADPSTTKTALFFENIKTASKVSKEQPDRQAMDSVLNVHTPSPDEGLAFGGISPGITDATNMMHLSRGRNTTIPPMGRDPMGGAFPGLIPDPVSAAGLHAQSLPPMNLQVDMGLPYKSHRTPTPGRRTQSSGTPSEETLAQYQRRRNCEASAR